MEICCLTFHYGFSCLQFRKPFQTFFLLFFWMGNILKELRYFYSQSECSKFNKISSKFGGMTVWSFNKITGISYLATRLIEMSYIFLFNSERFSANPNDNANQYFFARKSHWSCDIISQIIWYPKLKTEFLFSTTFFSFFITTHVFMNGYFARETSASFHFYYLYYWLFWSMK